MSIMEDAARLREIATSGRIPVEAIRAIQMQVLDVSAETAAILGTGFGFVKGIGATAEGVNRHLDAAVASCREFQSAIIDAADAIEQAGS